MFIYLTIFIIFTILIALINIINDDETRCALATICAFILFITGLFLTLDITDINNENKQCKVVLLKNNLANITTNGSIVLK